MPTGASWSRKDRDFREAHLLTGSPRQLLVVATGNVTNEALLSLFELHLDAIVSAFAEADVVQLTEEALMLSGPRDPSR
jgi:predicted nuclease of predicted toxin-antitoxin system